MMKAECDYCGREFEDYPSQIERSEHNFCSKECYHNWMSKQNNPNYGGGGYVECEMCGKRFWARPSKQDKARFCSRGCRNKWQSKMMRGEEGPNWNGGKAVKECPNCGKEFRTWPSVDKKFCSWECMKEYNRVEVVCSNCGKEVEVTEYEHKKHDNHFCSRECWEEWNRGETNPQYNREKRKCKYCGKEFRVQPSSDKKFCSKSCVAKSKTRKKNPN